MKKLSLFLLFLLSADAFATTFYYRVREGDGMENILKAFYQTTRSGNEITGIDIDVKAFAENLKKLNPKITDWHDLQSGTIVVVESSRPTKKKASFGFFYTASQGNFSEVVRSTSTNIDFSQTSPITLGVMSQFQFKGSSSVLPASIYLSKLNASPITGIENSGSTFSVPMEIGGNIYYQYSLSSMPLAPYAGLDFEKFTTFNAAELESGAALATRQNSLLYGTIGAGYNFTVGKYRLHVKASYSKTINSSTTSVNSADRFTGSRQMLYFNIKQDGPFLMHVFYKHHNLSGPTDLTVNRFGVGFGYFIF
jgi:hypothetical protein